jgi:hypothetical protein
MIDCYPPDTALTDHRVAASAINSDTCWIDTTLGMTTIATVAIRRSTTRYRAAVANGWGAGRRWEIELSELVHPE